MKKVCAPSWTRLSSYPSDVSTVSVRRSFDPSVRKLHFRAVTPYIAEVSAAGYRVHYLPDDEPEDWDLTEGLWPTNGILIYDAAKLDRVAKNELWFRGDPRDALLLVFKLADATI